jgi:hypothetical protein
MSLEIKIFRFIIVPVPLFGFETWSLTLKEEHRFRILRAEFGPKSRSDGGKGLVENFA